MGHTRSDTTQIYLRKLNRTKAMERVRDLDWGSPGFSSDEERRIRDSNPCYRRERAASTPRLAAVFALRGRHVSIVYQLRRKRSRVLPIDPREG